MDERRLIRELAALRNFGLTSARWLVDAGIQSVEDFRSRDPLTLYESCDEVASQPISRNLLKAIVGAQAERDWRDVVLNDDGISWSLLGDSETNEDDEKPDAEH